MLTTYHNYKGYLFYISSAMEQSYRVSFPDLPEVKASGQTLVEAFKNACLILDEQAKRVDVH